MVESTFGRPDEIGWRLQAAIRDERRDSLNFSVLTILLTPFFIFVVIAVILLCVAIISAGPGDRLMASMKSQVRLATGANIVLAYIFAAYFVAPKPGTRLTSKDLVWIGGSVAVFALLLYLSYATTWPDQRPGRFWGTYAILAPAMLALLGTAFMPKDPYYLGWYESIGRDTTGDEAISESVSDTLRFAAFLPALVLECYGQIFGSYWLWRHLDDNEIRLMTETLVSLESGATREAQDRLRQAPRSSSADVMRWLHKLRFVRPEKGALRLTTEGSNFVAVRRDWGARGV